MAIDDQEILEVLKKIADAKGGSSGREATIKGALLKKEGAARDELRKKLIQQAKDLDKNANLDKKQRVALKDLKDETNAAARSLTSFESELRKITRVFSPLTDTIGKLADSSGKGAKDLEVFGTMFRNMTLSGGMINALLKSLDYTMTSFREMSQVGASFGSDMQAMRMAAADAQLPLGMFSDLVKENAVRLADLFTTTEAGVKQLQGFTKGVRDAASEEGLYGLGLTVDELNEYMGTYLEMERFQSGRARVSQQQVVANTIEYSKQLDLLSRVTGVHRKQLDESVKGQQRDSVWQRALTDMTEEQKIQAQLLVSSIENKLSPAMAEQAKSIIATGIGFDEMGDLLMGMSPELFGVLKNFKTSNKDAAETMGMIGEAGRIFQENFPDAELFRFAGGAMKGFGDDMMAASTITAEDIAKMKEKQAKDAKKENDLLEYHKKMLVLSEAFESIKVSFMQAIVPGIESFTNFLTGPFKDTLLSFATWMAEHPTATAIALGTVLGGAIIFDFAKQVLIVTLGTTAGIKAAMGLGLFGAGTTAGMIGKGGKSSWASGKNLGKLAKGARFAGGAGALLSSGMAGYDMFANRKERGMLDRENWGNIGTLAGTAAGAWFGPLGMMAGGYLGGLAGNALAGSDIGRQLGTLGATGTPFESSSRMLHVDRGETVLNPQDAIAHNTSQNMMWSTMSKALISIEQNTSTMGKKLNMLVAIDSANERNTKKLSGAIAGGGADMMAG